jgi:ribosomal protein L24
MIKTEICKGDKVVIIKGEGKIWREDDGKSPRVCTVLLVDRIKGVVLLEMPQPKAKKTDRQVPLRGVEQWKTARYNQKTGEAGGLKIIKRPIHLSKVKLVEKGPRREFGKV